MIRIHRGLVYLLCGLWLLDRNGMGDSYCKVCNRLVILAFARARVKKGGYKMKWWQKALDYLTCYLSAWVLIIWSPLWFPFYLAQKIFRWSKE